MSGCFPDPESWFGLTLDGRQRLLVMSASPTRLALWVPSDAVAGTHTIGWGSPDGGADNAVTRSVTGIRRGNFKIEYSLSQPDCEKAAGS